MADPHSPYCLRIQQAIIVPDQGREDLLLQVNYEGPLDAASPEERISWRMAWLPLAQ